MQPRSTDDRRAKTHKIAEDNRKNRRRKEDKDNIISYYLVLFSGIAFIIFLSVISFIWGR